MQHCPSACAINWQWGSSHTAVLQHYVEADLLVQKGYLSVNYSENYFHLSQRHPEVPKFTPAHYEAMEMFTALASSDELRLDGVLQPGDIQLLSNHVSP